MTGPTHEEKRQIFERFLPGKLSHNEIDSRLHFARVESYPAGKEIYAKGSLGRSMMAVLRGRAKMTSVSRDGKEIVFNIMYPGEIFGEIALLDGGQRSADAIAMTDCEILVIHRRDFMPILEKRADICLVLLKNPVSAAAPNQRASRGRAVSSSGIAGCEGIVAPRR